MTCPRHSRIPILISFTISENILLENKRSKICTFFLHLIKHHNIKICFCVCKCIMQLRFMQQHRHHSTRS
jgi:hypothetical protein